MKKIRRWTKISKSQEQALFQAFVLGISALEAARFAGVHRNTASKFYLYVRKKIWIHENLHAHKLMGEIEIDESYFGGVRKGPRGRGAPNKTIVFGILERNHKVRVAIVQDVSAATLMREITAHTEKGCVYYTDKFKSYHSLSRYGKHITIDHAKEFTHGLRNHINGIEGFWSYAKKFLMKYNGVSKKYFPLYLKEIEWRFNNRHQKSNLMQILREML